jgi:shikimate dehydrogenase
MRQYGLIGYPLTHSFSQKYFRDKFLKEGITDAEFLNFSIPNVGEVVNIFKEYPQLKGLAVTIPYKKSIVEYLDEVSQIVAETGACNCIQITPEKKTGLNTDVTGFELSFKKNLRRDHTHALVLGTGGAAVAVQFVLKKLHINYSFVSRNAGDNRFTWDQITESVLQQFTVLINCTPLGTYPKTDELPPLPYEFLTSQHYLFDLVYNPPKTQFLLQGEKHGCIVQNGLEMLSIQAEENWRIWNV